MPPLETEVFLDLVPRDGAFGLSLGQSGTGLLEIQPVLELLQKPQVLHGNQGGKILSVPADNDALLAVGYSVQGIGHAVPRHAGVDGIGTVLFNILPAFLSHTILPAAFLYLLYKSYQKDRSTARREKSNAQVHWCISAGSAGSAGSASSADKLVHECRLVQGVQ